MDHKKGCANSSDGLGDDSAYKIRMSRYRLKRRPRWLNILGLNHTRDQAVKWRPQGLGALFIIGLGLVLYAHDPSAQQGGFYNAGSHAASRRLLSNSSSHGPEWERCDYEESHVPGAWLFSHTVCILIIFIALAIVCDDFFVPSLEVISEKLNLSEDVAGATFMAAGSSAPELFTSVAGVAVETDVGVGTIVGSAVFNLLIIIALTAALAGQVLHLDWRPLTRDAFFYAMSIGCFIGFVWDGYFKHYEAAILLVLYIFYILLMFCNPRLMDWMGTWKCCWDTSVSPEEDVESSDKAAESNDTNLNGSVSNVNHKSERKPSLSGGHARRISIIHRSHSGDLREEKHIFHHHQRGSIVGALTNVPGRKSVTQPPDAPIKEEDDIPPKSDESEKDEKEETEEEEEEAIQLCPCLPCCPAVRTQPPSLADSGKTGFLRYIKLILRWIIFIPAFPFVCLFSWTIPDCSKEHNNKYFLLSFIMSVTWIAILSFGMVSLVGRVGCILNVDIYIMGLVVVAIGTSIPDALSSVLVARDGYGDMAVSNAIGSNVFDINLGLGLPFCIRIAIDKGDPIELLDDEQWVDFYNDHMKIVPHAKFGFILLLILILALIVFGISRFRLNKWIGVAFVCIYVTFLVYAFIQELYCVRQLGKYC